MEIKEILKKFKIVESVENYGNGHINDTYLVKSTPNYILQRINTSIFKKPNEVMDNIEAVTKHLSKKIKAEGGNPYRETLTVLPTIEGENFLRDGDDCYRVYRFIEDTVCYEQADTDEILYNAAFAYGKFLNMLSDFPAKQLNETIVDFHNTPVRVKNFEQAISDNISGRLDDVKAEVEFARAREKEANLVVDLIASGEIPLKVTHNDTKLNNILFDVKTSKGLCVIDLDTVMPGSVLYDYGDALRFGGSTAAEDETDLSKVEFSLDKFKAYTKGFLDAAKDSLNEKEIELLPFSIKLMSYECGIRFLSDHLNGDTYFKIHRENHNLDRCRTQFKLVADIEKKYDTMMKIVKELLNA